MLYGYETWTLVTEEKWRILVFEMKCFRLLWVSYRKTNTNDFVRGHLPDVSPGVSCYHQAAETEVVSQVPRHEILSNTDLQGYVEGGRRRCKQKKGWVANVKEDLFRWAMTTPVGISSRMIRSISFTLGLVIAWQYTTTWQATWTSRARDKNRKRETVTVKTTCGVREKRHSSHTSFDLSSSLPSLPIFPQILIPTARNRL